MSKNTHIPSTHCYYRDDKKQNKNSCNYNYNYNKKCIELPYYTHRRHWF